MSDSDTAVARGQSPSYPSASQRRPTVYYPCASPRPASPDLDTAVLFTQDTLSLLSLPIDGIERGQQARLDLSNRRVEHPVPVESMGSRGSGDPDKSYDQRDHDIVSRHRTAVPFHTGSDVYQSLNNSQNIVQIAT
jgi:hypothetical protein